MIIAWIRPSGGAGRKARQRSPLRQDPFGVISGCSGSLRLAAQDVALSRRKQGFESPRERHEQNLQLIFQSFLAGIVPLAIARSSQQSRTTDDQWKVPPGLIDTDGRQQASRHGSHLSEETEPGCLK